MRILLVSDYYPPFIGGAHRQTRLLATILQRRGHDVTVATPWSGGLPEFEDDSVPVYRLRQLRTLLPSFARSPRQRHQPPFPDPVTVWQLRRLLRRVRPEIVHSYGWITYSVAAALTRGDVPLVISARDYAYSCPKRTLLHRGRPCSGPALGKCLPCSMQHFGMAKGAIAVLSILPAAPMVRRRVDGVHSVSTFVQHIVQRDFLRRPAQLPLAVIPSFLEATGAGSVADAEELDRWLEPVGSRPFILFVGQLRLEKGITQLLDAYAALDDPPPLVMMGTVEPDTPRQLPAGATIIEDVPHAVVMGAWDRCLFGVLPSLWPEPLGSVVYEGMSRGKAVIGTRPGGHTDMIDDGENGLLVEAGDTRALRGAMQRLLEDEKLRARLGVAARQRAQAFTDELSVPRFEELYRQVIARRRR